MKKSILLASQPSFLLDGMNTTNLTLKDVNIPKKQPERCEVKEKTKRWKRLDEHDFKGKNQIELNHEKFPNR